MKNKNIYLIPILAISLFAIILFGAGYAYFAASSNVTNVTNISASLPEYDGAIVTTSDTCSLTVNASDMLESNANNTVPVATSTCHLNVTLNGTPGIPFIYGVVLEETSTNQYMNQSIDSQEFRYTLEIDNNSNYNGAYIDAWDERGQSDYESGEIFYYENFPADLLADGFDSTYVVEDLYSNHEERSGSFYSQYAYDDTISYYYQLDTIGSLDYMGDINIYNLTLQEFELHQNSSNRIVPLAIDIIEVPTGENTVTNTYTFTEKWYNLVGIDQSVHANKTYTFELKVVNLTEYIKYNKINQNDVEYVNGNGTIYATDTVSIGSALDSNNYFNYSTSVPKGTTYFKLNVTNNVITSGSVCASYINDGTMEEFCMEYGSPFGSFDGINNYPNYSNSLNDVSSLNPSGNIKKISDLQHGYFADKEPECRYYSTSAHCNTNKVPFSPSANSNGEVSMNNNINYCIFHIDSQGTFDYSC